jgi:HD-like signal output (HDOD) protein
MRRFILRSGAGLSLTRITLPESQNSPNYTTPEGLVAAMGQLPAIAQVLARLQRLLSDTNSSLDDVAALIRLDAAMSTRVVQISNSVWFRRGSACQTIDEAVNRVGFREIFHLVSVVASRSMIAQPLVAYKRDAQATWRESLACAFAAELLANRLGEDTAVAYMCGLLHGIGRLAINKFVTSSGEAGRTLVDGGFPGDFSGSELALLGFTQADVGAAMLQKWTFATENIEPIRHQYDPLAAQEPHDRMSAILYAARFLRTTVCQGEPVSDVEGADDIFHSVRLERADILSLLPDLEQQISRAVQITSVA